MMRSMFSGVSGLRVHQTRMDVIGNNIANVNTVGYKSQRVTFNEVFSQTLQSATSASDETGRGGRNAMQVGLGVNVSSIDMLMTQGAAQRTDNPFDLMIDGDGFIVVGDSDGKFFTRAGALRQDADGNLVIANGMKVQGWPATADGLDIERRDVQPIKLNDPKNKTTPPETTTSARVTGNLNTDDGKEGIPSQIKMYDSLGNLYTCNIYLTYDGAAGEWSISNKKDTTTTPPTFSSGPIELTDQNGNKYVTKTEFPKDKKFKFDTAGKLIDPDKIAFSIDTIDMTQATPALNAKIGQEATAGATTPTGLQVDFSSLTQYSSKTSVDSKVGDKDGKGAGKAPGVMSGYDIGADGKITAYYDNGDRRLLGQVVVAQFDNPAGLEKVGDNLYKSTSNSGDFDNVGKVGNFQTGVLEMSNVDLSNEFTDMIITQRGFQANSRIISVSDEMLQELTNLKR